MAKVEGSNPSPTTQSKGNKLLDELIVLVAHAEYAANFYSESKVKKAKAEYQKIYDELKTYILDLEKKNAP